MNRQQRRAAEKGPKTTNSSERDGVKPNGENRLATTRPTDVSAQDWYYHATVHDGSTSRTAQNISQEHVLRRLAVPYKLNQRFRIDGFEVLSARVRRFKITRTRAQFDPKKSLQQLDTSSWSSTLLSLAAVGQQQINETEDVTDDILIQAMQLIASEGLKAEPAGVLDTPVHHNKAFVIMSFAPESREAFDAMTAACEKCGINAVRVDQEISSASIMDRIVSHLKEAKYVIADLTGARPNVYYEIGFFDALCEARGVDASAHMLLVAKDIASDAHFDLRHRGIEQYSSAFALMRIVERWLQQRKEAIVVPVD